MAVEPFRAPDESSHVAYAIAIGHGTIPRKDEPGPAVIPGEHADQIYTADHPPLFYLLVTGPLLLGIHSGHPLLGLHLARFESALFSAGTLLLTAALATALLGTRRPEMAVTSAGLLATLGAYIFTSSQVYNDSLGTLLSVAVLLCTLLVLRDGLRPRHCIVLVVAAALAISTRASNAEVVALAAAGLVGAGALHTPRRWRGAMLGLGCATTMAATCIAAAGWFYLLNQARYGHLTGRTGFLLEPQSIPSYFFSPSSYSDLVYQTFANVPGLERARILHWTHPVFAAGEIATWVLVGVGLLWWLRRRPGIRPPRVTQALVGLVVLHAFAGLFYVAWWVHLGGRANVRYLFPVLPVVAVGVARLLCGLPRGRIWAAVVVALQFIMAVLYLAKPAAEWTGTNVWNAYPAALARAGVPAASAVTILVLLIASVGCGLCIWAILADRSVIPRHGFDDAP